MNDEAVPTDEELRQAFSTAPTVVVVPVKDFDQAKVRLAPALAPDERAALARAMATTVVHAARQDFPVAVVCDSAPVARWAREVGAWPVWCPGTGLNGAVQRGVAVLGDAGVTHCVITHADLPQATSYASLGPWPGVTVVPDRRGTGTNVLALSPQLDFTFAYGAGSFARHVREATRLGQGIRISHEPSLQWDVDIPEDLTILG